VILEWAAERDLLAIGEPATSWFAAMFMHGVAATAEGDLDTPLLVSHPTTWGPASPPRILVASDGLDGSDGLVAFAGELAQQQHAGVTLLHVLGSESRLRPHRIQRQARDLELQLGGDSDVRIELGNPRSLVIEAAQQARASLIVMSSRRLRGLQAIGSVSRRVVHHAGCPVLLMPPESLPTSRAVPRSVY
jgi:nucleotide-binding universal stress UspA family protein